MALDLTRRAMLRAAGSAALFQSSLARALATPSAGKSGTIEDVEHVVLFMQENRSFDHYFGSMSGVRGFADPHPMQLPGLGSVWRQPDGQGGYVAPFAVNMEHTNFPVLKSLDHHWASGHEAWNRGRYDNWVPAKGGLTMGHLVRGDIPYHFALADAFTVCDGYFSSLKGPTCPNRLYYMTGSVDHHNAGGFGPVTDNIDITQRPNGAVFGSGWRTYAEQLQSAGVSWQLYRQGDDNSDDNSDGGMNTLLAFEPFHNAKPGEALYERGVRPRRLEQLKQDVATGNLAQVSWIVPPRLFCEHPNWPPAYGVEYLARIMDALTCNPAVWSKTVFLFMYDENDGYFDHVVPPTPALERTQGLSTVPVDDERHPTNGEAYGLGVRVPMLAISPWSKGGWVCSETFDHTSILRFLEKRFGVTATNVSAWRRAVCGDLTSAFDFALPSPRSPRALPVTPAEHDLPTKATFIAFKDVVSKRPRPTVPGDAPPPMVESGQKPSRPLGYQLSVEATRVGDVLRLRFANDGNIGAHFHVIDRAAPSDLPRRYTIEAGKDLVDDWSLVEHRYALDVHGPAGNNWWIAGDRMAALDCVLKTSMTGCLAITVSNTADAEALIEMVNGHTGRTRHIRVPRYGRRQEVVDCSATHRWYDVALKSGTWLRRYAGRIENGKPGLTDPAMAAIARSSIRGGRDAEAQQAQA